MKLQQLIHQHTHKLSDLDNDIIQFIMEQPDEVVGLSIIELAEKVHISKSSILRLTKKLGFSGYSEFKYFLRQEQNARQASEAEQLIFDKQLDDIKRTINYLEGSDLLPINELLDRSKTIYCYSTGFSQKKPLEEFSKLMLALEKRVLILPNKTELDMAMPMIRSDDCVIVASFSGETENVKENLTTWAIRKIPTLTITTPGNNYFARHSDFHLNYYCTPFQVGQKRIETSSLIALNCLMDYLYRSYGAYTLLEE